MRLRRFGAWSAPATRPWSEAPPSDTYLIEVLFTLLAASLGVAFLFKASKNPKAIISKLQVRQQKVNRALQEIERKTFHICGLLVPITHQMLLKYGVSNGACCQLCWAITIFGWASDCARLRSPFIAKWWPGQKLLRDFEKQQLTGGCYFSLGPPAYRSRVPTHTRA